MSRALLPLLSALVACDQPLVIDFADLDGDPFGGDCPSERTTTEDTVVAQADAAGFSVAPSQVLSARLPAGHTVASATSSDGVQLMYLSDPTRYLDAGLYEVQPSPNGAQFVLLDGAERDLVFTIGDTGSTSASTPLGDDMCAGAPDLLMEFCQDFVACAAYDLWC
jgi:hypothetical protein